MVRLRWIAVLALASAAIGCATSMPPLARVTMPTDGDRARLRVAARNGSKVALIPEKDCVDLTAPGVGLVLGPQDGPPSYRDQSLGMPGSARKPGTSAEIFVRAGVPLTLVYEWQDCEQSITFTPAPNGDYEAYLIAASVEEERALHPDSKTPIESGMCTSGVLSYPDPKTSKVQYSQPKRCR